MKPDALFSTDLGLVVKVVRETFVDQICSEHHVPSPCDCGEPLNKVARDLFEPNSTFDPLCLENSTSRRVKAFSVFVASIVLSLALTESASASGFRWP